MKADPDDLNSLCGATTVQVDIDLKDATVGFDVSRDIRVLCGEMAKNATRPVPVYLCPPISIAERVKNRQAAPTHWS